MRKIAQTTNKELYCRSGKIRLLLYSNNPLLFYNKFRRLLLLLPAVKKIFVAI